MTKLDKFVEIARTKIIMNKHGDTTFNKDATKSVAIYDCPKCEMSAAVTIQGSFVGNALELKCTGKKK